MVEKEEIEAIKRDTDLVALIESKGIPLKKNGKGYKGLCPFHEDKTPSLSVNPETKLWNCFGCDKGGDVIRFVELFDKIDFPQAVSQLSVIREQFSIKKKPSIEHPAPCSVKELKLLSKVLSYYQHSFNEDQRGLRYLKDERGITNHQTFKDFGVGYANGNLLETLPDDEEIIKALKRIGVLNSKGHEIFYNCVVFPLYDAKGGIVGMYGRNIVDENEVKHLYLPGPRSGLVNRQAVKRSQSIILTESVIDALTLYDQGFKNVIPTYGVNGLLDDHLSLFKPARGGSGGVKEVYLVFDADAAGKQGAEAAAMRLKEKEIIAHIVTLPDKDVNIFFKRHTPEEFERLLKEANPQSLEQSDKVSKRKQSFFNETKQGFEVAYADRQYEIKGILPGTTQLKVTIKASKDLRGSLPFELTTIDLYSSRSRAWFAKLCADLFEESEDLVKEDIAKILSLVEVHRPKEEKPNKIEPSPEEKKTAFRLLKNPEIFSEILDDLETLGVTGEKTNKLVGYLSAVSRKLDEPLSVLIQSRSAAGKSTLQDAVLSLVPEEDFVKYTRVTDQALFYKEEDSLVHKILAIEEEEGMGGAAYSIRNIQSSKKITVAATGKDPGTGKMRTEEYTVKGPVAVMVTTTAAELEGETASRFIFLTIDESSQMTEAIHRMQRESETLEGLIRKKKSDNIIKKHQTAQRLLRPLHVVNPYSKYLSFPCTSLRTRRDHKKYLGLIRAVAFLYQYQRKVKTIEVEGKSTDYIEVTLEDIDRANRLANEVLGQSLDDLARPSRTLLSSSYNMVKEISEKENIPLDSVYFTRRMIREYIGWTDWQVKTHIKQLEELEYLYVQIGSQGKRYAYVLNYQGQAEESNKCYLNLTPVEEIRKLIKRDKAENLEGQTAHLVGKSYNLEGV